MLLKCPIIQDLWLKIKHWLEEIGFIGYTLSESKIILGDIENGNIPTTAILLSKKVIYYAFKRDKLPALAHIQNETKHFFYLEKYGCYLKHKSHIFEKRWKLLNINYYKNQDKRKCSSLYTVYCHVINTHFILLYTVHS